jgi:hypothetical protein
MPEFDLKRPFWGKQSVPALPPCSDINLLGNRERIVDLDTKVSDGALHLRVAQEELYCPQIASAPVDQRGLGAPDRVCPE